MAAVPLSLLKWQCFIEMNFGRCVGRLLLDWMYLCEFSSNFFKNWSGVNSLVVRDHLVLLVDGSGAVIVS
jgi:hypothetical protein